MSQGPLAAQSQACTSQRIRYFLPVGDSSGEGISLEEGFVRNPFALSLGAFPQTLPPLVAVMTVPRGRGRLENPGLRRRREGGKSKGAPVTSSLQGAPPPGGGGQEGAMQTR